MKLALALNRKSNNFDLLRLIAASAVIFGHAYAIAPFGALLDPVLEMLVFDPSGTVAVKFFFFLSGLVVTNSLLEKKSAASFVVSRGLRVFPGLIVCVLFAVVVGAFLSTQNFANYLSHPDTISYLYNNSFLQSIKWTLPGVFEKNPLNTVNGSLWTLSYEIACYAWLLVLFVLKMLDRPMRAGVVCFSIVMASVFFPEIMPPFGALKTAWFLPGCFFLGAFAVVAKDEIEIDIWTCLALWMLFYLCRNTMLLQPLFYLALFYTSLYIATRDFFVGNFKLPVDISYGVYLYGFIVQQTVKQIWPEHGPFWNMAWSLPTTMFLAYLSFVLFERPAMRLAKSIDSRYFSRQKKSYI